MAAEGRAPSGPPPLTADDLARLRDWAEEGHGFGTYSPESMVCLLDMVTGYQQLVAGLQQDFAGIDFDLEVGWQEYADVDGDLDWHPLAVTSPDLWALVHLPYSAASPTGEHP